MSPFQTCRFIRLLAVLLLGIVPRISLADQPAPLVDSITTSPNGRFDFVMLGVDDIPPEHFLHGGLERDENLRGRYPSTGVYPHGSNVPLWTAEINAFYVVVSDDGHHVARLGPWPSEGEYDELAIDFFEDGRKIQGYSVRDLIGNKVWCLPRSVSHYRWLQDVLETDRPMPEANGGETIALLTRLGQTLRFDLQTGQLFEHTPATSEIACTPYSPMDNVASDAHDRAKKVSTAEAEISLDDSHYTNTWALMIFLVGIPILLSHSWYTHRKQGRKNKSGY